MRSLDRFSLLPLAPSPKPLAPGGRLGAALLLLLSLLFLSGAEAKSSLKKKPSKPVKKSTRIAQVRKAQARIARDWYNSLHEPLNSFPADAVKGRTIVIDPGHTNITPGAEGPRKKITEADVNWGVASALAKLLSDAGARAILTGPYGKPIPVKERNLGADLDRRAEVANREKADLFISIHHNWAGDMAVNHLELYYKLEDQGPSRDIGNLALVHMTRNLGLDGSLLPANYRVLRVNTRPAILTEASYISNPIQESLLTRPDKQLLEAQSIYLGILDYFARGVPEFRLQSDGSEIATSSRPKVRIRIRDRSGLDRNTVRASLDGIPALVALLPAESACALTPTQALANGRHVLRFDARNTRGNSGIPFETTFVTDREPASIALSASPAICPPGKFVCEVRASVYDRDGQPVADTRRVSFSIDTVRLGDSALRSGQARIYLSRAKPGTVQVTARCDKALGSVSVTFAPAKQPLAQFRVLRADNSGPVERPVIRDDWHFDSTLGSPEGVANLAPAPGDHAFTFSSTGFRPTRVDLKFDAKTTIAQDVHLEPMLAGALLGRRVTLDPAGRYEAPDTTSELSDLNLATLRRLAALLERSGADVQIVRQDTLPKTRVERVTLATAFRPDLYVKLSSRVWDPDRKSHVGHYPNSEVGKPLAAAVAAALNSLKQLAPADLVEDHAYEITNAPCPAVGAYLRFTDTVVARVRSDTILSQVIARELLIGLARQRGAALPGKFSLRVSGPDGRPVPGARVLVDGLLTYWSDPKGEVAIQALDLGHHRLQVTAPGRVPRNLEFELTAVQPAATGAVELAPAR